MRQVVLISGHICTGKSELALRLKSKFGYHAVSTSQTLGAGLAGFADPATIANFGVATAQDLYSLLKL